MKNLIDKHMLFNVLRKNKIDVGEWHPLNNLNDLKKIVKKMGYPKKLVLKPRRGSGSKGVIILTLKSKFLSIC